MVFRASFYHPQLNGEHVRAHLLATHMQRLVVQCGYSQLQSTLEAIEMIGKTPFLEEASGRETE